MSKKLTPKNFLFVAFRKRPGHIDYTLLFCVIILLAFGFVMLYSTSAYNAGLKFGDSAYYLRRQMGFALVGFFIMALAARFDYHLLRPFSVFLYAVAFFLCVIVIFVGREAGGASRWLAFGSFSFQPSEVAKVFLIIFLAALLSRNTKEVRDNKFCWGILGISGLLCAVVAYNNLSTGLILAGITIIMLFVAKPGYRFFVAVFGILLAAGVLFIMAAGYRMNRIDAWLHPETSGDKGYQTLQGLYAIGSGGLIGKGLGESMQKLGFVPEAQNDMIFSIICEELGLFGALVVIIMYLFLLWRFMVIATHVNELFGSFLIIGIMSHIALQVILNIAVVTNTIPNTGITLPFISYGGTSLVILLFEMGIALSVSKEVEYEEEPSVFSK